MNDLEKKSMRVIGDLLEDFATFPQIYKAYNRLPEDQKEALQKVWRNIIESEFEDPATYR